MSHIRVPWSLCLFVCLLLTDRDAIWGTDSRGPRSRVLGRGLDLHEMGKFLGIVWLIEKHWESAVVCTATETIPSSTTACNRRDNSVFNNGTTCDCLLTKFFEHLLTHWLTCRQTWWTSSMLPSCLTHAVNRFVNEGCCRCDQMIFWMHFFVFVGKATYSM